MASDFANFLTNYVFRTQNIFQKNIYRCDKETIHSFTSYPDKQIFTFNLESSLCSTFR